MKHSRGRRQSKSSGFTIVELAFALVIVAVVLDLGVQMSVNMMNLTQDDAAMSDRAAHVDSALMRLRSDAWSSAAIKLIDSGSVELTIPGSSPVTWNIQTDGSIQRTDGSGTQNWPATAQGWRFERDDVSLIVADSSHGKDSLSRVPVSQRLVSQILLAARQAP